MDIELLAIDLDGTFVDGGRANRQDLRSLSEVLETDIHVVPATTRLRRSTHEILKEIDIDKEPLVCNNGARVLSPGWGVSTYDDKASEEWLLEKLDGSAAERIAAFVDDRGYELSTVFSEHVYWRKREGQDLGTYEKDPKIRIVEKNKHALERGTPISFMMHDDENGKNGLKEVMNFLEDSTDLVSKIRLDRHHRWGELLALTIYSSKVSKKRGLDVVLERLDIPWKNVLAIGDDEVDLEMLQEAGKGLAMENSPEHVKEVSDVVLPSCSESGLSYAIEEWIK